MKCRHKFTSLLLLLALITVSVVPAHAKAPVYDLDNIRTCDTVKELFNQELNERESLTKREVTHHFGYPTPYGGYTSSWTEEKITDLDYVIRDFKKTITLSSDATISHFVFLMVQENCKLVVEEGVTLTVVGRLEIKGTLENKGTIVINTSDRPQTLFGEEHSVFAVICNRGISENTGSVQIKNGTLENEGGTYSNKGTITITTQSENQNGLVNNNLTTGTKTLVGTINNTGTIHVKNSAGTGIKNYSGAVIQNDGKIVKSGNGNVTGTISGNAVTTE